MMFPLVRPAFFRWRDLALTCLACLALAAAQAAEFSVSPIRAELGAGALSETLTVSNHSTAPLRVSVKLMEWTQDAEGKDVYQDSQDLVYFPRQMEVEPGGKRLVRIGAKGVASANERTYRLFVEEEPPATTSGSSQVSFYFRFGVPVFVAPATAKAVAQASEPTLLEGKLSVVVRNTGNRHFRLQRVTITDGGSYSQEIGGWYSLAGSQRTYSAAIPADVCRRSKSLLVTLEGEGVRLERKLDVDPAHCA